VGSLQITHLLDTHVWLQRVGGEPLPALVEDTFLRHPDSLAISAISLWEVAKLVEFRRIELSVSLPEFFASAITPELTILPITPAIASTVATLESAGFHKDPADQIIVGTALVHGLRLISDDSRIRQWKRVPMLWRTARG
jgi:PIN domain nuclease of toxin-antitoxin system